MVRKIVIIIAACMVCVTTLSAQAATTLTASVDRTTIKMDEHVVFTLSLINSDTRLRAEGLSPNVELGVLSPDFDTSIPRADNRFKLSREGGHAISSITVELFPKHTGRFTLPSFQVDGQRSQPITINVSASSVMAAPEVFVRSGVNKTTAWAREQIVVYLELLHRVNLDTASLGGDIQTSPVRIELFDYRKLTQTERKEQIAGMTYNVQRMAWALFPTQGGELTVRLPDIWAITDKGAEKGRRLRLPGKQHSIQIKALPAGVPADILVGKPELSQSPLTALSNLAPDINSLTSWNISLRAPVMDHTLSASLPGLTAPAGIKLYLDNAQRQVEEHADGIVSIANYTVSVTPLAAGEFRMPTIRIPYFDPQRGIADVAESSGQTLIVKTGPQPAAVIPTPNTRHPIQSEPAEPTTSWTWKTATIIFAALWLATLTLWLRARALASSRIPQEKTLENKTTPAQPETLALRPLQTMLLEAFQSQSLEQGLNEWEAKHGIDQELRKIVRAVQRLYYGKEKPVVYGILPPTPRMDAQVSPEAGCWQRPTLAEPCAADDASLQSAVRTAIAKIHANVKVLPVSENKWNPESFTHRA